MSAPEPSTSNASAATGFTRPHRLRLATLLWLGGMSGIVVVYLTVLPALLRERALPVPLDVAIALGIAQGAAMLALVVACGVLLAPRIGLHAPVHEALAAGMSPWPAWRRQWKPGVWGGLAGGAWLLLLPAFAPPALADAAISLDAPLSARLLYGGITEEIMLRWGLMTLLLWVTWRLFARGQGRPSRLLVGSAIAASALAFGIGHLPAAQMLVGMLDTATITYVVVGNTAFGIVAGVLYARHGLESAMLAHALAHLLAWIAG